MACIYCKKLTHEVWSCPTKPAGWVSPKSSGGSSAVERQPSKLGVEGSTPSPRSKKSAAPKGGNPASRGSGNGGRQKLASVGNSDTAPPPAIETTKRKDTRKGDRHKPGYQAQKQREYRKRRAAAKEGK